MFSILSKLFISILLLLKFRLNFSLCLDYQELKTILSLLILGNVALNNTALSGKCIRILQYSLLISFSAPSSPTVGSSMYATLNGSKSINSLALWMSQIKIIGF